MKLLHPGIGLFSIVKWHIMEFYKFASFQTTTTTDKKNV